MRTLERGDITAFECRNPFFGSHGAPYNMGKTAMEALAYTLAKEEKINGVEST